MGSRSWAADAHISLASFGACALDKARTAAPAAFPFRSRVAEARADGNDRTGNGAYPRMARVPGLAAKELLQQYLTAADIARPRE